MLKLFLSLSPYQYQYKFIGYTAAEYGHFHILEWLRENYGEDSLRKVTEGASVSGNIPILIWATKELGMSLGTSEFKRAACSGKCDTLEWLYANGWVLLLPFHLLIFHTSAPVASSLDSTPFICVYSFDVHLGQASLKILWKLL